MRLKAIDSHAAGEPTRTIIEGFPDLGRGPMLDRRNRFDADFDHLRKAIILEPRGSDVLVGALLQEPCDPTCDAGVIFFNNVGPLNMCGHGTMCLVKTLQWLGRKPIGDVYRIETPVGIVEAEALADGWVSIENVPAYRQATNITVNRSRGDVAWGGNWFYLTHDSPCEIDLVHIKELTEYSEALRRDLNANGYPEVDHIEICTDSPTKGMDSRNFVLCPGGAYDRSPCGTGTSAHIACLSADGLLKEGHDWHQESVIGSHFIARYRREGDHLIPIITGPAFITGELTLILQDEDPFRYGIA